MGLANYSIIDHGDKWVVLHDGEAEGDFETKEAAFESAVAAASVAVREGHEVHVSVPGREAGNKTALGARNP
ncbi:MAG: hypothetical protein J0G95_12250 [Rhizobiales bacterium]|nr:hypothetical protein [Hyphomicrobiales bacterium]